MPILELDQPVHTLSAAPRSLRPRTSAPRLETRTGSEDLLLALDRSEVEVKRPVDEAGWARVPDDWPGEGPIDLQVHDLPHRSSTLEWWYLNCHLETVTGRRLSLFASFFRLSVGYNEQAESYEYAHALSWALCDADSGQYYADSRVDPCAPEVGLKKLERGEGTPDPLLRRAMREVLEKGHVPYPDRLIEGPISVSEQRLDLDLDGNRLCKQDDGAYRLELFHDEFKVGCQLTFHPLKRPVRHGDNGVVRGVSDEAMFYYFIPRCRIEGLLIIDNRPVPLKEGSGWYDHEFGRRQPDPDEPETKNVAWNWISAQLDNGYEITAYDLFDHDQDGQGCGRWVIVIDPAGRRLHYQSFTFEPQKSWTSTRTFNDYPTEWRLEIPEAQICLAVEAAFADQEFVTVISKPAFWEGRVRVHGAMRGQDVSGLGFVERSGFASPDTLKEFLAAVSRQTLRSVQATLPLEPTYNQALRLVASDRHAHYLEGLDLDQYARTVIRPIREIVDRGGKAWRSYALLACIDVVGGDSREFASWLAIPELLHTGSLIVDDVQDRSTIRRGGPACHATHGEALAVNAGTAAYFLAQPLLDGARLTAAEQLRLYDLYFEVMRAAHAGQAADIDGLGRLMPQVVESGDGELLERRLLATHRLKSAVPARSLAMMGAIIGHGSEAQIDCLGHFFEMIGLAFQIMDDVLNLRGFQYGLKSLGEDISHGKVTMPVAKAMSRLPQTERRWLWETISSKPTDPETVSAVIGKLESCCALTSCAQQASDLVESAWHRLDPLLRDSYVKLMLRAFSWYVLERTY